MIEYLGRRGLTHMVLVPAHGARGRVLRYVSDAELRALTVTREHHG